MFLYFYFESVCFTETRKQRRRIFVLRFRNAYSLNLLCCLCVHCSVCWFRCVCYRNTVCVRLNASTVMGEELINRAVIRSFSRFIIPLKTSLPHIIPRLFLLYACKSTHTHTHLYGMLPLLSQQPSEFKLCVKFLPSCSAALLYPSS